MAVLPPDQFDPKKGDSAALKSRSAFELPVAVRQPATEAFDPARARAGGEDHHDVAADAAFTVAEGARGLDDTAQAAVVAIPHEAVAVADLGERYANGVERGHFIENVERCAGEIG